MTHWFGSFESLSSSSLAEATEAPRARTEAATRYARTFICSSLWRTRSCTVDALPVVSPVIVEPACDDAHRFVRRNSRATDSACAKLQRPSATKVVWVWDSFVGAASKAYIF